MIERLDYSDPELQFTEDILLYIVLTFLKVFDEIRSPSRNLIRRPVNKNLIHRPFQYYFLLFSIIYNENC